MIEFWFEFASPYSYIAAMRIGQLCRDSKLKLRWWPFMLGPIFELQGWSTSHFNLNPLRGKYMWRDMERLTEKLALPWRHPTQFPRNCSLAARVAAASAEASWIERFVTSTFIANFGDDRDLNNELVILDVLSTIVDDPEETLRVALSEPARSCLRKNTEQAKAIGLFGAPNCVVGDELFWGEEALEDAIEWALRKSGELTVDQRMGVYSGPEL
ncbi:MAG: 2-hydroxychromene-2-carboxylate isomerase [Candidatus Baltobacteraceae bacterium]